MTFSLSLRNQDSDDDDSDRDTKACSEYVGKTLQIERNALVAVVEPYADDGNDNPVLLVIYVWDDNTNLTSGDIYSDYGHGELYSAE